MDIQIRTKHVSPYLVSITLFFFFLFLCENRVNTSGMKKKHTHDYLFIRIIVLPTNFSLLFNGFMYYLSFRIIKFVFTVLASIFWCLSLSNRNIKAFTIWTNFNKIPRYLKKFIIGLFKKSTFLSSQKLISDFSIVAIHIKKSVQEVIIT
ncbi:Uncharacterised protein [uncultured archaeon]|nr:Uncharacterised protein [uncultured archaeon]